MYMERIEKKPADKGIFCVSSDEDKLEMVDWLFRLFENHDLRQTIVYCDEETKRHLQFSLLIFRWKENVEWGECIMN
jgi:hypothetical protein